MPKTSFDYKLYRESFRQLRPIGLAGTVVLCIASIAMPIGTLLNSTTSDKILVDMAANNPLLSIIFLLLVPIMVLYLFNFLNKRDASDYYFSLANTRTSLLLSMYAAIVTWILLFTLSSIVVSWCMMMFLSEYMITSYVSYLVALLNVFGTSLYIASAFLMAMMLTGTTFTYLMLAVRIIILQRLFFLVFSSSLRAILPVLPSDGYMNLLDVRYNLAVNYLMFNFFNTRANDLFTFWPGGLYMLGLGILYLFGCVILFKRRKSELAQQPAPNRKLQAVYRICVSMAVCLYPCQILLHSAQDFSRIQSSTVFLLATCYLIALFVYFLYELITTKKLRNLVRAIPGVAVLICLNLAFVLGGSLYYHTVLHIRPSASSIRSVTFVQPQFDAEVPTYAALQIRNIEYRDERLNEIIASSLNSTLEHVVNNEWDDMIYSEDHPVTLEAVRIDLGHFTILRTVMIPLEYKSEVMAIMQEDAAFQEAFMDLPSPDEVKVFSPETPLSGSAIREIYATLREEVRTLPFERWYSYMKTYPLKSFADMKNDQPSLTTITAKGFSGLNSYSTSYMLSNLTPRTATVFMQKVNEENLSSFRALLNTVQSNPSADFYVSAYAMNFPEAWSNLDNYWGMFTVTTENLGSARADSFFTSILQADLAQIDSQQPYLQLDFYAFTAAPGQIGNSYSDSPRTLYIPCPDVQQFRKYLFGDS